MHRHLLPRTDAAGHGVGYVKDIMGYKMFFIFVMACCLITFLVTAFLKIDPEFGKKK